MQNKDTLADTTTSKQSLNHNRLPLVVGVDLGGTQIRTAVLRGPTLLSRVGLLTGEQATPDRIIPRLFVSVQEALEKAGTTLEQIAGIGLAAPGPMDHQTGLTFSSPQLL